MSGIIRKRWLYWKKNKIAVIVDPKAEIRKEFHPDLLVDAILAKKKIWGPDGRMHRM